MLSFSVPTRTLQLSYQKPWGTKRFFSRRSEKNCSLNLSLYLVTHRPSVKDENEFIFRIKEAVRGGVTCVQLRDYNEDIQASIKTAFLLKRILPCHVSLIINNRVDVACAVGAGVHLNIKRDFPYKLARKLLGEQAVIGLTVESWADVMLAQKADVDYLSPSQLFPSVKTKTDYKRLWGLKELQKIRHYSRHRLVPIGGITEKNLSEVYQALNPNDGAAMVGELWRGEDPFKTAKKACLIYQEVQRLKSQGR